MENESKMRPAESGLTYEAPRVEVFEVMVERGFENSPFATMEEGGDVPSEDFSD
jgi:hypothetical protein